MSGRDVTSSMKLKCLSDCESRNYQRCTRCTIDITIINDNYFLYVGT